MTAKEIEGLICSGGFVLLAAIYLICLTIESVSGRKDKDD